MFDLFEGDEHHDVPRSNSKEVSSETLVEGHRSLVLEDRADHDDRVSGLTSNLVHQAGLKNVDGRTDDDSVESSSESTERVKSESFTHAEALSGKLLVRIIGSELSSVDDGVTHDVGNDTDPESSNTVSS